MNGKTKYGVYVKWNITQPCGMRYTVSSAGHHAKCIKPDTKRQTPYDSTYIRHLEKPIGQQWRIGWWLPGLGKGKWGTGWWV